MTIEKNSGTKGNGANLGFYREYKISGLVTLAIRPGSDKHEDVAYDQKRECNSLVVVAQTRDRIATRRDGRIKMGIFSLIPAQ